MHGSRHYRPMKSKSGWCDNDLTHVGYNISIKGYKIPINFATFFFFLLVYCLTCFSQKMLVRSPVLCFAIDFFSFSFFLTSVQDSVFSPFNLILSVLAHLFNLLRPCQIQCFSSLSKIDLIHKYHEAVICIFT